MAEPPRSWLRIEKVGQGHFHYLTDEGRNAFGNDPKDTGEF
jgi:hypothetical protein